MPRKKQEEMKNEEEDEAKQREFRKEIDEWVKEDRFFGPEMFFYALLLIAIVLEEINLYSGGIQPVTNYPIACMQFNGLPALRNQCSMATPPVRGCGGLAWCYRMEFRTIDGGFEYEATMHNYSKNGSEAFKHICITDAGYPGWCDRDGICYENGGRFDESIFREAVWKDNCDELNPCWSEEIEGRFITEHISDFDNSTWSSREWLMTNSTCDKTRDAVVWMQHMRCQAGNGRIAKKPCQGLPLRLWLYNGSCGKRNETEMKKAACPDDYEPIEHEKGKCHVTCRNASDHKMQRPVPDGVECNWTNALMDVEKIDYSANRSYCFAGACFPVSQIFNATSNPIPNLADCRREKEKDLARDEKIIKTMTRNFVVTYPPNDTTCQCEQGSCPNVEKDESIEKIKWTTNLISSTAEEKTSTSSSGSSDSSTLESTPTLEKTITSTSEKTTADEATNDTLLLSSSRSIAIGFIQFI